MANTENLKTQVRLGVSPLSWTNDVLADLGGDVPLEVCLKDAAEIGYEGVELGRKFPKDPKVLSPKLSEYGLQLAAGWYSGFLAERSLEAEWNAAADHIRLLEGCGCRGARLWRVRERRPEIPLGPAAESKPCFEVN